MQAANKELKEASKAVTARRRALGRDAPETVADAQAMLAREREAAAQPAADAGPQVTPHLAPATNAPPPAKWRHPC